MSQIGFEPVEGLLAQREMAFSSKGGLSIPLPAAASAAEQAAL